MRALLDEIERKYKWLEEQNNILSHENKLLKSERYKDIELSKLNHEIYKLQTRCNHYGLDDTQWSQIEEWEKNHKCGRQNVQYMIDVFAVTTAFTARCRKCGEEKTVYD